MEKSRIEHISVDGDEVELGFADEAGAKTFVRLTWDDWFYVAHWAVKDARFRDAAVASYADRFIESDALVATLRALVLAMRSRFDAESLRATQRLLGAE